MFSNLYDVWYTKGFPCDSSGKESAFNAGDLGSISGLGRSPGEGNGYTLRLKLFDFMKLH